MGAYVQAMVMLCLSCLPFLRHHLLHLHAFIHQQCCISFRYARCTMHGRDARDGNTGSKDGGWWTHLEDGWMDGHGSWLTKKRRTRHS